MNGCLKLLGKGGVMDVLGLPCPVLPQQFEKGVRNRMERNGIQILRKRKWTPGELGLLLSRFCREEEKSKGANLS